MCRLKSLKRHRKCGAVDSASFPRGLLLAPCKPFKGAPKLMLCRSKHLRLPSPSRWVTACQSSDDSTENTGHQGPWSTGVTLPETVTEQGDAERGRHLLLHSNYMSCGIPYKLWENELSAGIVRGALAVADDAIPLPGREGRNADLPYMLNAFTTTEGVDVVNANCLHCHAESFQRRAGHRSRKCKPRFHRRPE